MEKVISNLEELVRLSHYNAHLLYNAKERLIKLQDIEEIYLRQKVLLNTSLREVEIFSKIKLLGIGSKIFHYIHNIYFLAIIEPQMLSSKIKLLLV